jgi:flagellar biosynthetic protein FlhB
MAEDSDLERTEPASSRRLEKAREEGQVARSRELSTFLLLITGGAGAWWLGGRAVAGFQDLVRRALDIDPRLAFDSGLATSRLGELSIEAFIIIAPLFGLLLVVAAASPMLLGGWLFSTTALVPDFTRLNPLKGIARMFSSQGLAELAKAALKAALVAGIAGWVVWANHASVFALLGQSPEAGIAMTGGLVAESFVAIVCALALIAAADVPWQMWQHASNLRMTREEVRQERKEQDGDPQIKARIRSLQRETARRRMMSEVPKADVVVTNPSHYAIALAYRNGEMRAPRVVAKGAGHIARKIREIALASGVPLLEAPPLARALHKHTEIGDEIPETLYAAVAEVLAYVFQLKKSRNYGAPVPTAPSGLPVPAGLDPLSASTKGAGNE